jgi:hypothetical protein
VRGTESDERRHQVYTVIVGEPRGESRRLRGALDDLQPIAQPLDRSAGNEDRALERIRDAPANAVGGCREQSVAGGDGHLSRVEQQEAPGAVGGFRRPGPKARLADERRLLIAGDTRDRQLPAKEPRLGGAVHLAAVAHLREQLTRDAQQAQQLLVPALRTDVVEQRPRGVGDIGRVHASARQPPEEERVDRSEGELTALGSGAGTRHVIEDPRDLGGGEVGVEQETRPRPYELFGPRGLEARTFLGRAPVLPDDGAVDRCSARTLPDDDRLALIGDTERCHPGCASGAATEDLLHRCLRVAPDLLRIVLDPARIAVVLRQCAPRDRHRTSRGIEDDGARRGGALIDGDDVLRLAHAHHPGREGFRASPRSVPRSSPVA